MATCTATTPTRQRKPRVKPPRFACLVVKPDGLHAGVLRLFTGRDATDYVLERTPAAWGTGFLLTKVGDGAEYHTNIGDASSSPTCECLGFLKHGHCKHVESLQALAAAGRL
jgi:hypothetical protein